MISRRRFFQSLACAAALLPFRSAFATTEDRRHLSMLNTHTGEELAIDYCECGLYRREALEEINHFLRCHFTNEVKPIDVGVLDLLSALQTAIRRPEPARIISGYRSPAYNDRLRREGRGVAERSLHMEGLAIDFAMLGVDTADLARLAKSFQAGGVGLYPGFVHIDTGRVRHW